MYIYNLVPRASCLFDIRKARSPGNEVDIYIDYSFKKEKSSSAGSKNHTCQNVDCSKQ